MKLRRRKMTNNENERIGRDLIKISNLWWHKDKKGREYLTGSFGLARIFVFPNNRKKASQDADYLLYVSKKWEIDKEDREEKPDKKPLTQSFKEKIISQNKNGGKHDQKN
jgi:hypothetical protein